MLKLGSMKISARLMLIVLGGFLSVVIVAFYALTDLRDNMIEDRQEKTKNLVTTTVSLLNHFHKLEQSGALDKDEAQAKAKQAITDLRYGNGNYFWVFTEKEQVMVVHPTVPDLIGRDMSQSKDGLGNLYYHDFDKVIRSNGEGFVDYYFNRPNSTEIGEKLAFVKAFKPWDWVVGTGIYMDDVNAIFYRSILITGLVAIAVLVVVGSFSFMISRGIATPIYSISGNMKRLADGDQDIDIDYSDQKSEIGDLARSMIVFREKTIEMSQMRQQQLDNEKQAEADKRDALYKLADSFEQSVGVVLRDVVSASDQMQNAVNIVAESAHHAALKVQEVEGVSRAATNNVETVAAATEELSASIAEISSQVAQSSGITSSAVAASEHTQKEIELLADAASQIGEVVALIAQIADQTNLLALNATIEAARAGDAGKGFAVVANEVKNLATQTARATDDIRQQVTSIQDATTTTVKSIGGITVTIRDLDSSTGRIAAAVEEQGAATQEIARNIEHAASGTRTVSDALAGVADGAKADGERSQAILTLAQGLMSKSETLNKATQTFLAEVRSS